LAVASNNKKPIIKTNRPEPVCTNVSGMAASNPQYWETRIRIGMRTTLDSIAIGIVIKKRIHFLPMLIGVKYAKTAPKARKAISERSPEHGFPTRRCPAGIKMLKPSAWTGMPIAPTNHTPTLAANILSGRETMLINARGSGNIKIRKRRGNQINLHIFVPNKKRANPVARKKRDIPEMEKTYSTVPKMCKNKAKTTTKKPAKFVCCSV